jgi:hypothetical protein
MAIKGNEIAKKLNYPQHLYQAKLEITQFVPNHRAKLEITQFVPNHRAKLEITKFCRIN